MQNTYASRQRGIMTARTIPHLSIEQEHSGVSEKILQSYEHTLRHELEQVRKASEGMYETPYASINLSLDNNHIQTAKSLADKYKNTSLLVVIGIGGSNLGTIAIQEAILGKQHNLHPGNRPKILYADTVDPDSMNTIQSLMDAELKKNKKVVLNLISKSGGTTETIANFEILYTTLKKYKKQKAAESVVVTTDDGSHLWHFAKERKFKVFAMPKTVGGRYSVFSPVGLFPLALLGIDIKKLLDGAADMRAACLRDEHNENPAILRAAMIANAHASGKNITDNFYFKTDLESIGKWYRQLMGESIGKEYNKAGTEVIHAGITPTVSIGSTDLHSMAQLYFGGPNDKFFTLVSINKFSTNLAVPVIKEYDALVPNIQGKKLTVIMDAICDGVATTLENRNKTFCRIKLHDSKEESIGALLQLHMMEIIYLAAIYDVNPFDQPNVEEYKVETKRILAKKR